MVCLFGLDGLLSPGECSVDQWHSPPTTVPQGLGDHSWDSPFFLFFFFSKTNALRSILAIIQTSVSPPAWDRFFLLNVALVLGLCRTWSSTKSPRRWESNKQEKRILGLAVCHWPMGDSVQRWTGLASTDNFSSKINAEIAHSKNWEDSWDVTGQDLSGLSIAMCPGVSQSWSLPFDWRPGHARFPLTCPTDNQANGTDHDYDTPGHIKWHEGPWPVTSLESSQFLLWPWKMFLTLSSIHSP